MPQPPATPSRFPTLMGAFGVAMGFAAFVLIREEGRTPGVFLTGLLAAAITSYVIEAVRERAEGGHGAPRPEPGRVLGLLVLLAVFEIFVSGVEKTVALVSAGKAAAFLDQVFVHGITDHLGAVVQLLLFVGLWMALGAAAAWSVAVAGRSDEATTAATTDRWSGSRQLLRKVGTGLALVAAMALAYVLLTRLAVTIGVLLVRPAEYRPAFSSLLAAPPSGLGEILFRPAVLLASGLERLAGTGRWGGVALLACAALLAMTARPVLTGDSRGLGRRVLAITLVGTLALLALGPFATSSAQFGRLLRIVGASALIWLAPLTVLALAQPRLHRSVTTPRVWGIVAFLVALLLVALTWDRLSEPPTPLYVASLVVALVVTGALFLRGADVIRFWPLVALTLAIAAFEGSSLLQRLTFLTTFKETALLQTAPVRGDDELRLRDNLAALAQWQTDSLIADDVASLVRSAAQAADDAPAAATEVLEQRTIAGLDSVLRLAAGAVCRPSGSAVLEALQADVPAACQLASAALARDRDTRELRAVADTLRARARSAPWQARLERVRAAGGPALEFQWYRLRWDDTASTEMRDVAASARAQLPAPWRTADPAQLVSLALTDAVTADSLRGWLLLQAVATSAPPDDAVRGWTAGLDGAPPRADGRVTGIPLTMLFTWRDERLRRLADLVEAGGDTAGPAPATVPMLQQADRLAWQQQLHTVRALRFAEVQLQRRRTAEVAAATLAPESGAMVVLELCLGASFAFWATAGLLAGLAAERRQGGDN